MVIIFTAVVNFKFVNIASLMSDVNLIFVQVLMLMCIQITHTVQNYSALHASILTLVRCDSSVNSKLRLSKYFKLYNPFITLVAGVTMTMRACSKKMLMR